MDFKLRLSQPALADFEDILEQAWTSFPATAERFGNDLLNHVEILSLFPYLGVPVRERPGIRKIFHTPYTVYYRIDETRRLVEVLHFWHGSRRPPKL